MLEKCIVLVLTWKEGLIWNWNLLFKGKKGAPHFWHYFMWWWINVLVGFVDKHIASSIDGEYQIKNSKKFIIQGCEYQLCKWLCKNKKWQVFHSIIKPKIFGYEWRWNKPRKCFWKIWTTHIVDMQLQWSN
jgi:hypothetical protein